MGGHVLVNAVLEPQLIFKLLRVHLPTFQDSKDVSSHLNLHPFTILQLHPSKRLENPSSYTASITFPIPLPQSTPCEAVKFWWVFGVLVWPRGVWVESSGVGLWGYPESPNGGVCFDDGGCLVDENTRLPIKSLLSVNLSPRTLKSSKTSFLRFLSSRAPKPGMSSLLQRLDKRRGLRSVAS